MIINKLGYLKIPQIFRNFSNSEKNFDKNKLKKSIFYQGEIDGKGVYKVVIENCIRIYNEHGDIINNSEIYKKSGEIVWKKIKI